MIIINIICMLVSTFFFMPAPSFQQSWSQAEGCEYCKNTLAEQFSRNVNTTDLYYNNETATLSAKIKKWPLNSNINRYEVMLMAAKDEINSTHYSCLSDSFLPHSTIKVHDCATNTESFKYPCILENETSFSVDFKYVYTGYYCFIVTPFNGTNSRRSHQKVVHFETSVIPSAEIQIWNTTIDLQPISHKKAIFVSFVSAPPDFHITGYQISLLLGSAGSCERKNAWAQEVFVLNSQQTITTEFGNKSEGYYCAVVTPIDFRCEGINIWTVKGSCARYSNVKFLKDAFATNVSNWHEMEVLTSFGQMKWAMELWITVIIMGASFILMAALIGIVMTKKSRKACYEHRLKQVSAHSPESKFCNQINESATKPEVILLYCRDSEDICRRVAEIRKKLQLEHNLIVHDYGDDSQEEEIAIEGAEWLPNRLRRHNARVIIINTRETVRCQRFFLYLKKDNETTKEEKIQLLCESEPVDKEFILGMQVLLASLATRQYTYQRVFNARFADDLQSEDAIALMTPFTSFILPVHFDQLIEHITSPFR